MQSNFNFMISHLRDDTLKLTSKSENSLPLTYFLLLKWRRTILEILKAAILTRNCEKGRTELLRRGEGARRENVNSRTWTHNYSMLVKRSCRVIAKAFSRDAVDSSPCEGKCLQFIAKKELS